MVATYRRQFDPLIARVAQPRNYDTDPFMRAVHILSKRLVAARIFTVGQIDTELQRLGYEYVEDRKVRYWAQMQPDLPERLIEMGVAKPEDFPRWARPFLRTENETAPMAQELGRASGDSGVTRTASTVYIVGGILAAWLGYKILNAIARGTDNPSRNSLPSPSTPRYPWLSD